MPTVAGDLTANAFQMTAAAFGLVAVITLSAEFFQIIKWLGVVYLAYIGVQLITSREESQTSNENKSGRWDSLFRQGFITSLANPFAIAFFAALFPQFIDSTGSILFQLCILGGTYILIDGIVLVLWGAFAVRAFEKLKMITTVWLNRICGSLMVLAAIFLANNDLVEE
jgi:threonine/homoserine/homoserine lactone efflux protein